jgi:translocation and assembly module TamA
VQLQHPPRARPGLSVSRMVPRIAALVAAVGAGGCSTTLQGAADANAPRIDDVEVWGNSQVDDDDIVEGLANRPPEGLFRKVYRRLDNLALEQDIARIEWYYQRRGFYSAKVVGTSIEPADDGGVKVTFRVSEGPPTRIAGLSLIGLSYRLQQSKLLAKRKDLVRPGQVFRHDRYLEFKDWMAAWMAHRGYPHARVEGKVDVDRDAKTADIRMVVDDGPLARFGKTTIRGLSKVPESAVRNRQAWETMDRFEPAQLELTQGRLYQLGLFSAVRMDYAKKGRPRITDIQISLTEARRQELRLGGGVAVASGLDPQRMQIQARGRIDYVMRHALHPLSTLRVELRPAWEWILADNQNGPGGEATVTLDRADLFLPRMTGQVTGGYEQSVLETYSTRGPLARTSLARPFLDDRLQIVAGWRIRQTQFFGEAAALDGTIPVLDDEGMPVDPAPPSGAEDTVREQLKLESGYRLAALEQTVSYDWRNDPLNPRYGIYAAVVMNEGAPAFGGKYTFVRATGDLRGYVPLGQRIVLAARAYYGRRLGNNLLPITERFFEGGATGHRGFGFRRLSPFVTEEQPAPMPDETPPDPARAAIGGDELFLGSGEVRVDIGTLASFPFGVVGFADAGDVVCDLPDQPACADGLDLSNLHWAAGGGVRWNPVIAVRLDVGWRLNRFEESEPDGGPGWNRLAIHLSLGQAF